MTHSIKRTAAKKAREPGRNGNDQRPPATAEAPKPAEVQLSQPKGRPMLTWVGKRPLSHLPAFPAQHIETFAPALPEIVQATLPDVWSDWPATYLKGGLLFHGDNKEVLAHLLANGFRGRVKLIYIDPPFDSGADYVRQVQLRGVTGSAKLDGETYTLGEQIQYTDIWANDNYFQFMYERLQLLKELLCDNGYIFVHCNIDRSHYLKCMADEVFGAEGFLNQVVWKRTAAHGDTHGVGNVHDLLLIYSRDTNSNLATLHLPYDATYVESHYSLSDPDGRQYQLVDLTAPGPRPGLMYEYRGVWPPPGRVWAVLPEKMEALYQAGRIVFTSEGKPRKKQYLDEMRGMPLHDIWTDIFPVNSQALEASGYPTQKPEALIQRVLELGSIQGDIVLDGFVGSGTTTAVAQRLGRRWIGCDINKGAIQTTAKRLQSIIQDQVASAESGPARLVETVEDRAAKVPPPAQLSFTVWRVNDYDLQIQHNEAVNLAAEHIGIQRLHTDGYFDGTLGNKLVKIVPFNRPLTPLDLDELRRELEARPDEARPITLVCLGMELAAKAWVDDWNRHRRGKDAVNRLNVIDLRVDPQYGGFIEHKPAQARVKARRKGNQIFVEVTDFISPTILARLKQQAGLLQPTITDWRSMVDCVMIDIAYDGQVFNVALSDVPERKDDLVQGRYELAAPEGRTVVAVKITDMLGEEVLVTQQV